MLFNSLWFICFYLPGDWLNDWMIAWVWEKKVCIYHWCIKDKNHNIIRGNSLFVSVCFQCLAQRSLDLDLDFLLNSLYHLFLLSQLSLQFFCLLSDLLDLLWRLWVPIVFFIFVIGVITGVDRVEFWVGLVVNFICIGFKFLFVNFFNDLLLFFFLWRLLFFLFRDWQVLFVFRRFQQINRPLDRLGDHDRWLGDGLDNLFSRLSSHLWLWVSFINLLGIVGGRLRISLILLVFIGISLNLGKFLIRLTIKYMGISLVALERNESQDKEDKDVKVVNVDKNHVTR